MSTQTQMGALHATPQGAKELLDLARKMNGAGRQIAEVPEAIQALSDQTKVYIFNVGPWEHHQMMGSLGQFNIMKCEPGQRYWGPLEIPGLTIEHYPLRENAMDLLMGKDSDGFSTAQQIIGNGKHLAPSNSLSRYGVSVSRTWPPSEADVLDAEKRLRQECEKLCREADAAMAQGPKSREETIRPDRHFVAARLLNKTVAEAPWMAGSIAVGKRINCPFCDTLINAAAPVCTNCKQVVNEEAFEAAKVASKSRMKAAETVVDVPRETSVEQDEDEPMDSGSAAAIAARIAAKKKK